MSAVPKGWMAPARTSSAKMGKPVSLFHIVPGKERSNYKHKIFWSHKHTRLADQYNSVVTIYKTPCLRRWLDFVSGRVPKGLKYVGFTDIPPVNIRPKPDRYWTLLRDGEPYACYTNCIECWLLVLSGEIYGFKHKWTMLYTDRSGR